MGKWTLSGLTHAGRRNDQNRTAGSSLGTQNATTVRARNKICVKYENDANPITCLPVRLFMVARQLYAGAGAAFSTRAFSAPPYRGGAEWWAEWAMAHPIIGLCVR